MIRELMRVLKLSIYANRAVRQINPSIKIECESSYYPYPPFVELNLMGMRVSKIYLDNKNWDEKSALEKIDRFVKYLFDMQRTVI
jgi:hypothetical protein